MAPSFISLYWYKDNIKKICLLNRAKARLSCEPHASCYLSSCFRFAEGKYHNASTHWCSYLTRPKFHITRSACVRSCEPKTRLFGSRCFSTPASVWWRTMEIWNKNETIITRSAQLWANVWHNAYYASGYLQVKHKITKGKLYLKADY